MDKEVEQRAQDLLTVLQGQRDHALNQLVEAQVYVLKLQRELEALKQPKEE